jgi:hypothetical protein
MFPEIPKLVALKPEIPSSDLQRVDLLHRLWRAHVMENKSSVRFTHVELVAVVGYNNISFIKQLP